VNLQYAVYAFIVISGRILFKTSNAAPKFCRGTQNTHLLLNKSFPENRAFYEIMCEKYDKSAQATDSSTVRHMVCVCWITKTANTHKLCNIYRFFTAQFATQTRLIITLYSQWISCCYLGFRRVEVQNSELNSFKNSRHLTSCTLWIWNWHFAMDTNIWNSSFNLEHV